MYFMCSKNNLILLNLNKIWIIVVFKNLVYQ